MRLAILSVKYLPAIMTLLLIVQCLLSLADVEYSNLISTIYGHSILYNLLLLSLSYAFRFCLWHRILIVNLIFINIIEWIDVNIYEFEALDYVLSILLLSLLTSLVSTILYFKYGCFSRNIKKADSRNTNNDR